MSFIKKYNELNSDKYKLAGEELTKLGHSGRGKKLIEWGEHKRYSEISEKAEYARNIYSKYGKLRIYVEGFHDTRDKQLWGDLIPDEFDYFIHFSNDVTVEEFGTVDDGNDSEILHFNLYIIPTQEMIDRLFNADHKTTDKQLITFYKDELSIDDFSSYFFLCTFTIEFKKDLENQKLNLSDISICPVEMDFGKITLKTKRDAAKFRELLYSIFNKDIDYPTYPNNTLSKKPMYDEIQETLVELDVLTNYGLEIEDIAEQIKIFSTNKLYKEI